MDIIFDVDGTLMNNSHRQHLAAGKDWPAFHAAISEDVPHFEICMLARLLHRDGNRIIITTGRFEAARIITGMQLIRAGVRFEELLMRPDEDYTSDHELKKNMLIQLRRTGFHPVMAFDDRDRVVAMWREMGLRCLQVAPGDF